MNRLPEGAIGDLVRDGVRPADLRERGSRAVFGALVRTAASVMQRGWDYPEWVAWVDAPMSKLGTQAKVRRGKPVPVRTFHRTLAAAWDAAGRWLAARPAADDVADEVTTRVTGLRDLLADPDLNLSDEERAVLAYAVTFAESRGTLRPALSRRNVAENAGLTERVARRVLDDLAHRQILPVVQRGRASADPNRQRATLYRLPEPADLRAHLCRVPRPMGRPPKTYGTPRIAPRGTPAQTYGTPTEGDDVEHVLAVAGAEVTISGSASAVAEFVRRVGADSSENACAVPATPREGFGERFAVDANVVPIRREDGRAS